MTKSHWLGLATAASTIIAVVGVAAAWAQYEATKRQADIAAHALLPQLEVTVELVVAERWPEQPKGRVVKISSDGGPIYNLSVYVHTWFEILNEDDKPVHQDWLWSHLVPYQFTGKTKGELVSISSFWFPHNSDVDFLMWRKRWSDRLPRYWRVRGPLTLVYFKYTDSHNKEHRVAFHIEGMVATKITKTEADSRLPKIALSIRSARSMLELSDEESRKRMPFLK